MAVRREDEVTGSGVLQKIHDGVVLTLSDLLYVMTSISANPSTNLLIYLVSLEKLNWPLRKLGKTRFALVRIIKGLHWGPKTANSSVTANDVGFPQAARGLVTLRIFILPNDLPTLHEGEHLEASHDLLWWPPKLPS